MKTHILILSAFISLACTPQALNQRHYSFYYQAGISAERGGDLTLAKKNYSKALHYAYMPSNITEDQKALITYELARVEGRLGNYAISKNNFDKALLLLKNTSHQNSSVIAPILCEYANLNYDLGDFKKSTSLYSEALPHLEKLNISAQDPIAFSELLERYSFSLEKTGDFEQSSLVQKEPIN